MAFPLDRLKTALANHYTIERELGEGGMATVYLADDAKHGRKVALKVLRPELAAVIGRERFLQEIRVTANLHHPHIVQLYDSGEADGVLYYVMPSVEGESLRDKLNRENQLSVDEAVAIAGAVADALDYAHRRDVIHRDLKPENILLQEGTPLLADFGVALAVSRMAGERLTETGLSLGTPSYMSPEQAVGDRELTARSDVYALGSVLYEMLAGDPPFLGSNVQAVIAKVISERPVGLRRIRDTIPPHVEAAVEKALSKVPADRFASAKEFAEALVTPSVQVERASVRSALASNWRRGITYVLPAAALLALAWALLVRGGEPGRDVGVTSTVWPLTSFVGWEHAPSWSPDGSMIAYVHIVAGDADIATLSTAGGEPHILTAASPADEFQPSWSPDGSKIAYVSDRGAGTDVYWIPPTGGAERKVAETNIPFLERMGAWARALGANAWSPDGQELLFSRLRENGDAAVWKVNLTTGEQTQLTSPPPGADDLGASWSFDGEQIAFTRNEKGMPTIWLLPVEGGEPSPIIEASAMPAWFPDNERIAFMSPRGGAPNIWEMELGSRELRQLTTGGRGFDFSPDVAHNGSIAYVEFDHQVDVYWIRLNSEELEHERLTTFTGENFAPRVSPDGNRIVYYRGPPYDLWLLDRTTGQHQRLTEDPASDRLGDWSPDGEEIVFMSDRDGAVRLWVLKTETRVVRQLTDHALPWSTHTGDTQNGPRWSPDRIVIGYLAPEGEGSAIWLVGPDGSNRHPSPVRNAFSFGWYRDSQRVVYTRRAPDGSGLVELRAAHFGTGEDVLLRSGALSEVSVSLDGTAVTFIESISHFTMDLQLLRLKPPATPDQLPSAVGEPQQITFGKGVWHVHAGGWAPDGSGVVYSRDADGGDIYVIEPPG
jgi:serine/threonine-protein kinase